VFDLSLDTSGSGLYKRGIKTGVTQAPIRENLAFAILMAAGFEKENILVDPMCGSGTFSLEAAMIQARIPAGFFRNFAFESWPGFKQKQFDHLKKQAARTFCLHGHPAVFASDLDAAAVKTLENNIRHTPFNHHIQTAQLDFFDITPPALSSEKGVVILNPPYGKRLTEMGNVKHFYQQIGAKLKSDFKGWRYGIVLPSRHLIGPLGLPVDIRPFLHGGLDLFAGVGIIQ
jgi:putative N6-adenine-specific DNA methylase